MAVYGKQHGDLLGYCTQSNGQANAPRTRNIAFCRQLLRVLSFDLMAGPHTSYSELHGHRGHLNVHICTHLISTALFFNFLKESKYGLCDHVS